MRVSRIIDSNIKKQEGVVNKIFVQMLEALGHDIELTYVKRKGSVRIWRGVAWEKNCLT